MLEYEFDFYSRLPKQHINDYLTISGSIIVEAKNDEDAIKVVKSKAETIIAKHNLKTVRLSDHEGNSIGYFEDGKWY